MGSKEVEKRLEYRRVFWCVIVGCWMEVYIYIYIFFEILSDIVRLILFKYLLARDNYCQLQREELNVELFFSDFWITILNYWMIICLDCAGIRLRKIGCGEKEILDVWSGRRLKWNSFCEHFSFESRFLYIRKSLGMMHPWMEGMEILTFNWLVPNSRILLTL